MMRAFLVLVLLLPAGPWGCGQAAAAGNQVTTNGVRVIFDSGHRAAADRVAAATPSLFAALGRATGLRFDFQPTVVLAGSRLAFKEMGGGRDFVAFAVPERRQVVLDMSRFQTDPTAMVSVLKHEYAHLLLHRHIPSERLPRWLDEGIAQHLSDGLSEYLPGLHRRVLGEALAADRVFSLSALHRFPSGGDGLQLAYEQSRSVVAAMVRRYGDRFLAGLIGRMAGGWTVDEAFRAVSGIPLADFEDAWQRRQRAPLSWLARMAGHVYGILFFLAAVATLWGFIRHLRRRRDYDAEED